MGIVNDEKNGSDIEAYSPGVVTPTEDIEIGEGGLKRNLKGRHMQMIAIGGSIGAGLFVGVGGALASGGPGNVVIDFIIIGIMLLLTVNALGELAGKLVDLHSRLFSSDNAQLSILSLVPSITTQSDLSTLHGDLLWAGTMQ